MSALAKTGQFHDLGLILGRNRSGAKAMTDQPQTTDELTAAERELIARLRDNPDKSFDDIIAESMAKGIDKALDKRIHPKSQLARDMMPAREQVIADISHTPAYLMVPILIFLGIGVLFFGSILVSIIFFKP